MNVMKTMRSSTKKQIVQLSLLKNFYKKSGVYEVSERELSNRIQKINNYKNE